MSDVTQVLRSIQEGNERASEELLPLVYDELRQLAALRMTGENPGQTLQPTALVHEAYVRLVDAERVPRWDSRGHFFAAAAKAMRRILVNRARDRQRLKRGGDRRQLPLEADPSSSELPCEDVVALDEALGQLAAEDERSAAVVDLRFFSGLSPEETAGSLNVSRRTVDRHWAFARAWLYARLRPDRAPARRS
jgi:RNA polymerase sigma factor (TIGR02999 family)